MGIKGDDIFGLVLWVLPIAIVGCRVYYVIAEWDRYKDNLLDIFKIWEGGIAMYGGTIAGVLTVIVWSRAKKIPFAATLDAASSGLILGQVIGRWANFVNREAFGGETDIFCRMGLTTPDGTTYYVHPTFLYESLWNLVGFIIIRDLVRRGPFLDRGAQDGQPVHTRHQHTHIPAGRGALRAHGTGDIAHKHQAAPQADLRRRALRGRAGGRGRG